LKKFEIVYGHAYWDQGKLFDEKIRDEKFHDTVPLRQFKVMAYQIFGSHTYLPPTDPIRLTVT
jgi:hypothetical protein